MGLRSGVQIFFMIIVFTFGWLPWMKASQKASRERMVFGDATWLHLLSQVIRRKIILQWGMRIELRLNFLGNLATLLGGKLLGKALILLQIGPTLMVKLLKGKRNFRQVLGNWSSTFHNWFPNVKWFCVTSKSYRICGWQIFI